LWHLALRCNEKSLTPEGLKAASEVRVEAAAERELDSQVEQVVLLVEPEQVVAGVEGRELELASDLGLGPALGRVLRVAS
jgi:hypothetical protein